MLLDWNLAVRGIRGASGVGAGCIPRELRKAWSERIVVGGTSCHFHLRTNWSPTP